MPTLRRQVSLYIFSLSDLVLLSLALYVSIFTDAVFTPLSILAHKQIQVHTIVGIAVLVLLWKISLPLLKLYESKRLPPSEPEILTLLKASVIATVLVLLVGIVFNIHMITPVALLRFLPLTIVSLSISRLVMRQSLKAIRRRGHNFRHLLLVGTNARAVSFADGIAARPDLGYRLVGFVDDSWVGPVPEIGIGKDLVADIAGFRPYLRSHVIDEVMLALPLKSHYDQVDKLIHICQEHGVIVRLLNGFFDASHAATDAAEVDTDSIVSFYTIPNDELGLGVKRVIDIVGSTLLIALFSPVMLAAMILIKLDSEGPALFSQERIGLNKRRFRLYKLRSMVPNAEKLQVRLESRNEMEGPVFKIKNDPRITRIGKFLRKTSIDELPQLFNVLKGDMSLVGPRPLPVRDYTGFNKDWQRRRFSVRPGITCLWQVSGRSAVSFDQWMHLDIEYIDRWSLWLDLKILLRTIPAVMRGSGAA